MMWLFSRKPRVNGPDSKELLRCYPPELPMTKVTQKCTYDPLRVYLDKLCFDFISICERQENAKQWLLRNGF